MDTNTSELELLLAACREEKGKLPPLDCRTTGEAIHSLVIEVLVQVITRTIQKKEQG